MSEWKGSMTETHCLKHQIWSFARRVEERVCLKAQDPPWSVLFRGKSVVMSWINTQETFGQNYTNSKVSSSQQQQQQDLGQNPAVCSLQSAAQSCCCRWTITNKHTVAVDRWHDFTEIRRSLLISLFFAVAPRFSLFIWKKYYTAKCEIVWQAARRSEQNVFCLLAPLSCSSPPGTQVTLPAGMFSLGCHSSYLLNMYFVLVW